jgi:peptide/nickel transport system permease protein/oligopeptide transport system permease protein
MFRFLVRRVLQMIVAFFGTTLIVYALTFAAQNDPVQALAGEKPVSAAERAYLTQKFHLDKTGIGGFFYRYWDYISHLLRGDLGQNLNGRPISAILRPAWAYTIRMALIAVVFVIILGVGAGVISGIKKGGWFDRTSFILSLLLIGIPVLALALLLQYFVGYKLGWFPPAYTDEQPFVSMILPAFVLGALSLATALRLSSTSVRENLNADYVRTATSKGLSRSRVISAHVLRNSLIPIVTFIGVEIGNLMGGAIITEQIFNVPGVGYNLALSIRQEDGPTVVGIVSVLVVIFLVCNLIVDLLYAVLDPRIRYS